MWANTARWLQEKAVDVAQRANVAAEELRQSRVVSELETTSKALLHNLQNLTVEGPGAPDEEAVLRAVKLKYVTERILAMAFPTPVDAVAAALARRHGGHFMIWNISEETYDYSLFENQVLEFKFPGHPAPPLGLLIKMCTSIENWLRADSTNVVVVHCLTGKGRTATVLSALLCWLNLDVGQGAGNSLTTMQALLYVSEKLEMDVDKVTIPSQRRYLQYFSTMVEGIKPRPEPLLLTRVIMNTIPRFGKAPSAARRSPQLTEGVEPGAGEDLVEDDGVLGCCPYLQLFKGGKLILTAPCSRDGSTGDARPASSDGGVTMLPWAFPSDGSIIFAVDCVVQGDILVRARHLGASGQKMSMFRAAFHTGYVPCGVLRLSKAQLDGACTDDRFEHELFIDLIFAPAEDTTRSAPPLSLPATPATGPSDEGPKQRREAGVAGDSEDKENYDAMLHRDTRFWNEIAARKKRAAARAKEAASQGEQGGDSKAHGVPPAAKFSIMGDGEDLGAPGTRDQEGDGASLSLFDNTPDALLLSSPLPRPSSAPTSKRSTTPLHVHPPISDDDLLQELEAAENAPVLREASSAPPPLPQTSSSAPTATVQGRPSGLDAGAASVPSATIGATNSDNLGAQTNHLSEISALAELEKELGLDLVLPPSTSAVGAGSSTSVLDFDDSLDDYEGFLESLGVSNSGKT